eukprot:SAG11_NODE_21475_length_424_cov_1.116923_1_plen_33_part_01
MSPRCRCTVEALLQFVPVVFIFVHVAATDLETS